MRGQATAAAGQPAPLALDGEVLTGRPPRRAPLRWPQVSPEVFAAVEDLEDVREALFEAQTAAGMTRWNESLLVDLRFAGGA